MKGSLSLGLDADKKRMIRRYETVKGKKADAERKLREILTALGKSLPVDTAKLTAGELLDK